MVHVITYNDYKLAGVDLEKKLFGRSSLLIIYVRISRPVLCVSRSCAYWMLVLKLLLTISTGISLASSKEAQVCWNECQVRFLPDVMSVFLRSLESPSAQVASPDSTNIS